MGSLGKTSRKAGGGAAGLPHVGLVEAEGANIPGEKGLLEGPIPHREVSLEGGEAVERPLGGSCSDLGVICTEVVTEAAGPEASPGESSWREP